MSRAWRGRCATPWLTATSPSLTVSACAGSFSMADVLAHFNRVDLSTFVDTIAARLPLALPGSRKCWGCSTCASGSNTWTPPRGTWMPWVPRRREIARRYLSLWPVPAGYADRCELYPLTNIAPYVDLQSWVRAIVMSECLSRLSRCWRLSSTTPRTSCPARMSRSAAASPRGLCTRSSSDSNPQDGSSVAGRPSIPRASAGHAAAFTA